MHRCFIESKRWNEEQIVPSQSEAHHLLHVMRAEEGDRIEVFNGDGLEAEAVVRYDVDNQLVLDVQISKKEAPRPFNITLIQAIPKGSRSDLIIEKSTEMGISRIIPVISERTIVRLKGKQAEKRLERWNRVAKSAAKQCGTKWLPQIDDICSYDTALGKLSEFDVVLLGSLADGVRPLRTVIQELQMRTPKSIAIIIGPEGDLTPAEIESSLEASAIPVSFGNLVLRAETAALYALSVLAYEFNS